MKDTHCRADANGTFFSGGAKQESLWELPFESRAGPGVEDLSRRRGSKAFPSRAVPCLTFIRRSTANGILVMIQPVACKKLPRKKQARKSMSLQCPLEEIVTCSA